MAPAVRRLFWFRGEPDPRLLQLGFVLLIALSSLVVVPVDGWDSVSVPERVALALSVLTLAVTCAVTPYAVDPGRLLRVLAFADLAVIGVTGVHLDVGTLPFVVLPALWLGRQLRWRAVPVSGLATLVLVTVPALAAHGNADGTVSQVVPLPFVAMLAAVAIAVGLDVATSAQVEAEQALAELAAQRRDSEAIVEAVDVGLVLLDPDGNLRQSNRRQDEIDQLKYPRGRRHGAGCVFDADGTSRLRPGDLPSAVAVRGLDFDDQRIWVGEDPAARRALSVSARAVRDDTGRRTGSVLAYKDVTDLMRAMAIKDEFIGLVSHELRTPLTSIYGYVGMLREREDLPEVAHQQLGVVARSADRLRVLVDDLLEAAQVTSGGLRLDPGPVDLAAIVAESLASARPHAAQAGIVLEGDLPAHAPLVGDRVRLAQVVDNLLSNAIKYTPRGGTVRVDLVTEGRSVTLRVRDTGMGIPSDDLAHVFTRFFRSKEASDLAIRGVGLGLSITKQIVEGHSGVIEVASEVGRGSEFRVVLPAA